MSRSYPKAKPTEGTGLVIDKTPGENPDCFFAGYQQAGDRHNLSNPDVHNGDLQPRSFELVKEDLQANLVSCEVVNANPLSILHDRRIFPLVDREEVLDRSPAQHERPHGPTGKRKD
jgi:hypothetical protein